MKIGQGGIEQILREMWIWIMIFYNFPVLRNVAFLDIRQDYSNSCNEGFSNFLKGQVFEQETMNYQVRI